MAKHKFRPLKFLRNVSHLARKDFVASFLNDGGEEIVLPRIHYWEIFSAQKRKLCDQHVQFIERPKKEALLRRLVHSMYESGMIDRKRSVVDIGSWLADNALIWSRFLDPNQGFVYAIDPAPENIAYGKLLGQANGIANVNWIEAVCSDTVDVPLFYEDSLEHARFNQDGRGRASDRSTMTLDAAVGQGGWDSIGLIHVDVEGFELKVIRGAENIIKHSRPVILFEQHISKENVEILVDYLKSADYAIAMINEVLPECDLDCRNFMALPHGLPVPQAPRIDRAEARTLGIWYAAPGSDLIPVD